jgi:hypothetical protein
VFIEQRIPVFFESVQFRKGFLQATYKDPVCARLRTKLEDGFLKPLVFGPGRPIQDEEEQNVDDRNDGEKSCKQILLPLPTVNHFTTLV